MLAPAQSIVWAQTAAAPDAQQEPSPVPAGGTSQSNTVIGLMPHGEASKGAVREAQKAYLAGAKKLEKDDLDAAEHEFLRAQSLDPQNRNYAIAISVTRQHRLTRLVQQSTKARDAGDSAKAETLLAEARDRGADTGNALVRGVVLARLLEPPVVPVAPAIPVAPVAPVAYAPAAPGMPAAPAVPVAPVIATPGAFEPAPVYSTPDLGIGQPITLPTQAADAMAAALRQEAFEASLEEIFDLDGYAS